MNTITLLIVMFILVLVLALQIQLRETNKKLDHFLKRMGGLMADMAAYENLKSKPD